MKPGLIGVVINSELIIRGSNKIDNLYMNLIVLKGLRQKISVKGIVIKDLDSDIKVELVSRLDIKIESNIKYLVFYNKLSKFEFRVNDKLTKNLRVAWSYIFGYLDHNNPKL